ncbi:MAG: MDR family MFS transporter [Bdellovibrionota bacterium]
MIKKLEYKYIVSLIYVFILFLDRMDITITNVAMPTFAKDFHIPVTQTDWIATSFLIALGVAMPVSGWLSHRYGSKNIFIIANILFTFSSALCALSWNLESLIFFRVLQGIGGGIIVPVGMSMTYMAFEKKDYPKVANYTLIPTLVAPSIAPAIGGFILQYLSWHWIFIFHIPIGISSIWLSILYLREDTEERDKSKFDLAGFIFLTLCLSSLFYFLSHIGVAGIKNINSIISGISSIIFLCMFLKHELKEKTPLINLNFFKIQLFSKSIVLQIALQICYFGSMFLIALYFQFCIGMTPLQSGLSMTGQAVGTVAMLFFSGKLFNKFGPKYILILGFVCIAITTYSLLLVHNSSQILFANLILGLRGLSIGLVNGPLQACAMFDLERNETTKGSAIFNILRQIGISLGVALSCMILALQFPSSLLLNSTEVAHSDSLSAFKLTFFLFSCIAIFGAIFTLSIDNKAILAKLKGSQ